MNYQQIPKPVHDINSPIYEYPIKRLNISRFNNGIFLNADYKSLEIFIAALFSKDGGMTEALMNGADIHKRNAFIAFNVTVDEVTKDQRQAAKRVGFGSIYGITEEGLSKQLNTTPEHAKDIMDKVLSAMPQVKKSILAVQSFAKRYGYVETMQGNYRRLPEARNSKSIQGEQALRQAFNAVVQGSASYMTNTSLIVLRNLFYKYNLKSELCLTVHDSIGVDIHPDEIKIVPKLVKKVMETPPVPWLKCQIDDFEGLNPDNIPDKYRLNFKQFRFPLISELEWGKTYADGFDWDYDLYYKLGIDKYYALCKEQAYISDKFNGLIEKENEETKKDALVKQMNEALDSIKSKYVE